MGIFVLLGRAISGCSWGPGETPGAAYSTRTTPTTPGLSLRSRRPSTRILPRSGGLADPSFFSFSRGVAETFPKRSEPYTTSPGPGAGAVEVNRHEEGRSDHQAVQARRGQ